MLCAFHGSFQSGEVTSTLAFKPERPTGIAKEQVVLVEGKARLAARCARDIAVEIDAVRRTATVATHKIFDAVHDDLLQAGGLSHKRTIGDMTTLSTRPTIFVLIVTFVPSACVIRSAYLDFTSTTVLLSPTRRPVNLLVVIRID